MHSTQYTRTPNLTTQVMGNTELALRHFREALKLDPEHQAQSHSVTMYSIKCDELVVCLSVYPTASGSDSRQRTWRRAKKAGKRVPCFRTVSRCRRAFEAWDLAIAQKRRAVQERERAGPRIYTLSSVGYICTRRMCLYYVCRVMHARKVCATARDHYSARPLQRATTVHSSL